MRGGGGFWRAKGRASSCEFTPNEIGEEAGRVLVARAAGVHPDPSRTRKLSPRAQMVLHWRRCGRVRRRQHLSRLFAVSVTHAASVTNFTIALRHQYIRKTNCHYRLGIGKRWHTGAVTRDRIGMGSLAAHWHQQGDHFPARRPLLMASQIEPNLCLSHDRRRFALRLHRHRRRQYAAPIRPLARLEL